MPFYTYACPTCGHEETVLRSMSDRTKAIYHCGGQKAQPMKLQVSLPSVRVINPAVMRHPGRGRRA